MTQLSAVATPIPEDMPLTDIVAKLAKLNENKAGLEAALAAAKIASRDKVVEDVKGLIASNGFTTDEILPLLMPKTAGKKRTRKAQAEGGAAASASEANYPTHALNSDPTKTYIRGVLPGWMKDAMVAAGLDPKQGADRAKFKTEQMHQVEGVAEAPAA